MVLVDGPPGNIQQNSRFMALPIVLEAFKNTQIDILLDDYNRKQEKETVKMWETYLEKGKVTFRSQSLDLDKGMYFCEINRMSKKC